MSKLFKIKDHFKENKIYLSRSITAIILCIILLFIIIGRLFYLQIMHHAFYENLAYNNKLYTIPIIPIRGLIYDRNGIILANNIPTFNLEIIPSLTKDIDMLLNDLKMLIKIKEVDIKIFKKKIKFLKKFESIPIRYKLTDKEIAILSVNQFRLPAILISANMNRHYPYGEAMAHVIGYTGKEMHKIKNNKNRYYSTIAGKYGIEKSYDHVLNGIPGYQKIEIDAQGHLIKKLEKIPSKSGYNIYLSIDSKLQLLSYNLLNNNIGAAIAIELKTGQVLALVSKPSFDPNKFINGMSQEDYNNLLNSPSRPLYNRAIRGQYSPGSTIKPIIALQALDLNIINTNTKFYDPGYYQINNEGRLFRDWMPNGHGMINLENAIAESCTTFFYFIADKMGIENIYSIFQRFGLGKKTNIDIEGELKGIVPSPKWKKMTLNQHWFKGETLITGIGQGYTLVTPIQMASVVSTIANRGYKLQLSLLNATEKDPNKPMQKQESIRLPSIKLNNPKNWDIIIQAMQKVITSPRGTAHWIYNYLKSYQIAGKTGTVQVFSIKQNEKYDISKVNFALRDHGWFIAFAPINDPKIAVVVILEHNKGSPIIALKIIEEYFKTN